MVSDGSDLGVVATVPNTCSGENNFVSGGGEDFAVKFFRSHGGDSVMSCVQELPLRLARKCVEAYGTTVVGATEDAPPAAPVAAGGGGGDASGVDGEVAGAGGPLTGDVGSVAARQIEFGTDDEAVAVQAGKDFALMLTTHGKLYHSGTVSDKNIFLSTCQQT